MNADTLAGFVASHAQGISALFAMWTRAAPWDVKFMSRWRQRSERVEPRTYFADASVRRDRRCNAPDLGALGCLSNATGLRRSISFNRARDEPQELRSRARS